MNKKAIITDNEKAVVVLVIGESARKANFQLYGYQRDTNPLLSKQKSLKVYQATSCATYTTAGTKAILEPQNSDDLYELLPNYAFRTRCSSSSTPAPAMVLSMPTNIPRHSRSISLWLAMWRRARRTSACWSMPMTTPSATPTSS